MANRPLQVRRKGVEENFWEDVYHRLLSTTWPKFLALLIAFYLAINLIFGLLYSFFPGSIENLTPHDFWGAFSFSVQTFSTIGYGFLHPANHTADLIVTIESATGMIFTALITGLMFAKFSRPSARILFSNNILWTSQNQKPVLTLRLGNFRANRVFEGRARMTLLRDEVSSEGEKVRRMVDLKLVRNESPLFSLSWTLYHLIDESSPFFGKSLDEINHAGWTVNVSFIGLDQDFAQNIVADTNYEAKHIIKAKKFVDMIEVDSKGVRTIDFSKLDNYET